MVALGKPCPLCEAPLQHRILPPFSGDEAPLRITLHGMPVLSCDKPHVYFVKRDFALWLMNHLVAEDEATVPAGNPTGLIFKSYLCHDCGKALSPKRDHIHGFQVPCSYEGQAEFRAEVSMPVFRCTGCGKEQVHSLAEVRKLTPSALVHAFKAAGIKAPG
jgi:hypothetical protein